MKLSIVTSLYKSSPYVEEFYERITKSAHKITDNYELIFVNDGSPDDSLNKVLSLKERDKRIVIIDLSRNFGHHKALYTGLKHSSGDYVFLIDCDLEEDPEILLDFYREISLNVDIDSIYGIQQNRKGSLFRKITGHLFYIIFNFLSDFKIPHNLSMTRIMTRRFVDSFLELSEREIVLSGLFSYTGYNQNPLLIHKRFKGTTTYSLQKRFDMLFNSIVSFSSKPLVYVWWTGLLISIVSIVFMLYFLYRKLFYQVGVEGWTGVMVSVWFFSGLIIFFIGLVGLYITKLFNEVKERPIAIIKRIYR